MRAFGLALVAVALALAGYGIWLIAGKDVQGGRDAAGAIVLAIAAVAAFLGWLLLRSNRRA